MGWFDDTLDTVGHAGSGFVRRVGRVGHAIYQGGQATIGGGLAFDFVKAPFVDDPKFDGFIHTLFGRTVARGGDVMMATMGPHGVIGEAVDAFPEAVRSPGRSVIEPINNYSNNAYRNLIGEPLSTLMTMGSIADVHGYDNFFNGETWKEAYGIAQHRSPGQAVAIAFGTHDVLDDQEVAQFKGTDAYQMISGAVDIATRWNLDPQVLTGKGIGFARANWSLRAPIDKTWRAVQSEEEMANYANVMKKSADLDFQMAAQFEAAGDPGAAFLRFRGNRKMTLLNGTNDLAYYQEALGVDHWRSNQLTNVVTPWYARTQQSWRELALSGKITPASKAEWARASMEDLNGVVTRASDVEKATIGYDPAGMPIIADIPGTGRSIGEPAFDPRRFPKMGLQDASPEWLLNQAEFGAGVKFNMKPDLIEFSAEPRGYVPVGKASERLFHTKADPSLVGRDLVDKPWTKANGVIPDSLLGSVGSRDARLDFEGVGAPSAKVVDHTIANKEQVVAFHVGTEADPSILRATKKINSHPDIHTPSVPLMSVKHAETFMDNTKHILNVAAEIRDELGSLGKDRVGLDMYLAQKLDAIHPEIADRVLEKLQREFPEATWTGSVAQKRQYAERALELSQFNLGGPVVSINLRNLLTADEIHTKPVSAGQLANSEARITAPMAWDRDLQQYVQQNRRWEIHGDVRVQNPGLIEGQMPKLGSRTIMTQPGIDKRLMAKVHRFGMVHDNPVQKMLTDIAGRLHNPDPAFTGAENMPRTWITHSKLEGNGLPLADQVAPWTVPDKLFHTTGYADGVEASGMLEARLGGGFGTDPYNLKVPGVSLTKNEAHVAINEKWLREVVGPVAEALGPHPTEQGIATWLSEHMDELMGPGLHADRTGATILAKEMWTQLHGGDVSHLGAIASGTAYEQMLNTFAFYWQESHGLVEAPEFLVHVPDEVVSRIRANNVKTYVLDGKDIVNAPGDLGNPFGGSEYRYYGDIPIAGKIPVSHGGEASWSQEIEAGRMGPQLRLTPDEVSVADRESIRIKWEYDHNNPGPVTQEQRWKVAEYIRDRYYPNHAQGGVISWALASARTEAERTLVMRVFMGDFRALAEFDAFNIPLKKTLQEYTASAALVRSKVDRAIEHNSINALGESMTELYSGQ